MGGGGGGVAAGINSEILTTCIHHFSVIYFNCRIEQTYLSEGNIDLCMKMYNMYL